MNRKRDVSESVKKSENNLDNLIDLYKKMLEIRLFEERCKSAYMSGEIRGFCHLCEGQEAIPVGVNNLKSKVDIITGYRDHGFMIASGASLLSVYGELLGKESGCSMGRGGSMHMFNKENGFFGGHGIVGSSSSLGCGIAFANKYKNKNRACFAFLGDGATNQGQIYESMNMAKIWKLPVLFCIENNSYSMGSHISNVSAAHPNLDQIGSQFGISGLKCDGNDVESVINVCNEYSQKSLKEGPFVVEFKTYRYSGHSVSDPGKYRLRSEIEKERATNDPIEKLKIKIQNHLSLKTNKQKNLALVRLDQIRDDLNSKINNSFNCASDSNYPQISSLYQNLF